MKPWVHAIAGAFAGLAPDVFLSLYGWRKTWLAPDHPLVRTHRFLHSPQGIVVPLLVGWTSHLVLDRLSAHRTGPSSSFPEDSIPSAPGISSANPTLFTFRPVPHGSLPNSMHSPAYVTKSHPSTRNSVLSTPRTPGQPFGDSNQMDIFPTGTSGWSSKRPSWAIDPSALEHSREKPPATKPNASREIPDDF